MWLQNVYLIKKASNSVSVHKKAHDMCLCKMTKDLGFDLFRGLFRGLIILFWNDKDTLLIFDESVLPP
jgi:hypothetical protein